MRLPPKFRVQTLVFPLSPAGHVRPGPDETPPPLLASPVAPPVASVASLHRGPRGPKQARASPHEPPPTLASTSRRPPPVPRPAATRPGDLHAGARAARLPRRPWPPPPRFADAACVLRPAPPDFPSPAPCRACRLARRRAPPAAAFAPARSGRVDEIHPSRDPNAPPSRSAPSRDLPIQLSRR
nr:basic proline-rich protein-like [Aegilops tauschii subsp. strangulata]